MDAVPGPSRQRTLAAAAGFAVGLVLVGLALPRTIAYLQVASWSGFTLLAQEPNRTATDVETALNAYDRSAADLSSDAEIQESRLLLALRLLDGMSGDDARREAVKSDAENALAALARAAPANARTWALVAYAGAAFGLPQPVMPALKLSYELGPNELPCLALRAEAALRRFSDLPEELKPAVRNDMHLLWLYGGGRAALARIYLQSGFAARVFMREAIAQSDSSRRELDDLLLGRRTTVGK